MHARLLHGYAVCNGRNGGQHLYFVVFERLYHTGRARRLHAVDLDSGVERFDCERHARYKSAAAHGHHDGVYVFELVYNFKPNRGLTCNHVVVVEGVDEGISLFFAQFFRIVVRIVVNARHKHNFGAVALGGLNLRYGRAVGHTYHRFNAEFFRSERHALRVVTRRTGHNPVRFFLFAEL